MQTYSVPGWLMMETPPEEQGQIVSSSYGVDLVAGVAVRCTFDRSDGERSWACADLTAKEMIDLENWRAANGSPSVSGGWVTVRRARRHFDHEED